MDLFAQQWPLASLGSAGSILPPCALRRLHDFRQPGVAAHALALREFQAQTTNPQNSRIGIKS